MSRRLSRGQAAVLGLVVLAALGLGGWGLFQVGRQQGLWADTFEVRAGFSQVNGVLVGTPVRIRGVDAGTVAAIELPGPDQPAGQLIVRLRLDRRYQHMLFADATATIESEGMIGGRVVTIDPGTRQDQPLADGAVIASRSPPGMGDVVRQANAALGGTQELMKRSQQAVDAAQNTMQSVRQDADAIKKLPLIRGYVTDAAAILVRPDCTRLRQVFAASDLFEPQRSVLTAAGRKRLDEVGAWLGENRQKNSEVVVVAFADPQEGTTPDFARVLTEQQAQAVTNYLQENHKAQKTGWWFWKTRKVTALGQGVVPTPVPEPTPLPAARVEVIVFVPPE